MSITEAAQVRTTSEPQPQRLPSKYDGKVCLEATDVAEILGTSTWSIYEALREKRIKGIRIRGIWRIPRHVVEELLSV